MQNEAGDLVDLYIPRKWYAWLAEAECQYILLQRSHVDMITVKQLVDQSAD
jgi:hypothetical protein